MASDLKVEKNWESYIVLFCFIPLFYFWKIWEGLIRRLFFGKTKDMAEVPDPTWFLDPLLSTLTKGSTYRDGIEQTIGLA